MNATMTLLPGGLPGLPASLSPAARTAAANNPRDIVDSWLRSLAPRSVQIYRRSLAAFAEWASPSTASQPEQVLALIAQLGAGRSHLLLCGYRTYSCREAPELDVGCAVGVDSYDFKLWCSRFTV